MLPDSLIAAAGPSAIPLLVELAAAGTLAAALLLRRPVARLLQATRRRVRRPAPARVRRA